MLRRKPGNTYAIQLPNGRYAYCRLLQDMYVQFSTARGDTAEAFEPMMLESIEFTVGLHVSAYKDSRMSYITFVDFKHADDSIPPITYVYDIIKKSYSLYERGIMKLSTKEACDGLEPTSAWELDHVIDRLTGRVDWLAAMKRQEV